MERRPTHTLLAALAAILPPALVIGFALAVPPTLVAWFSQPERISAVAMEDGTPTLEQTVPAGERELDAVALVLPTDFGALDGTLQLTIDAEESGRVQATREVEVDLSNVYDWQLHVFRLPDPLGPGYEAFTLRPASEGRAYVAAGHESRIPESALLSDGQDINADLTVRLYDRVGWPEFLGHVTSSSETRAPVWWIGGSLALAPLLFGLGVWFLLVPPRPRAQHLPEARESTAHHAGTVPPSC